MKSWFSRLLRPDWFPIDFVLVGAALVLYLAPALTHLTTYPGYYEDETWLHLAVFEAQRGNGLTWTAFGDSGPPMQYTYNALVLPLISALPLPPVAAVRLLPLLAGALTILLCYAIARRLDLPSPGLAPVLLLVSPAFFLWSRYGRTDTIAQMFALLAVYLYLCRRNFLAGTAAGLAMACYPLSAWAVPACLLPGLLRRDWKGVGLLLFGVLVGHGHQILSILANLDTYRTYLARYGVSSSMRDGNPVLGLLHSLKAEPARYTAYLRFSRDTFYALDLIVLLPLTGYALLRARGRRLPLALLVVFPLLVVGALNRLKNPYYVIFALPGLSLLAAQGAGSLRPAMRWAVLLPAVLVAVLLHACRWTTIVTPTPDEVTPELAKLLPQGATVFAANRFGDLLVRRPDLQFFNFHALSDRSDSAWRYPTGGGLDQVATLIGRDPRPTSAGPRLAWEAVSADTASWPVYFIYFDGLYLEYLRSIYFNFEEADLSRLLPPGRSRKYLLTTVGDPPRPIQPIAVYRVDLDRGERRTAHHR
jgi:4-amino-4-deoxy-L-arabinose transferase-like glycosyltransferase